MTTECQVEHHDQPGRAAPALRHDDLDLAGLLGGDASASCLLAGSVTIGRDHRGQRVRETMTMTGGVDLPVRRSAERANQGEGAP
jgi:hypothetical protein